MATFVWHDDFETGGEMHAVQKTPGGLVLGEHYALIGPGTRAFRSDHPDFTLPELTLEALVYVNSGWGRVVCQWGSTSEIASWCLSVGDFGGIYDQRPAFLTNGLLQTTRVVSSGQMVPLKTWSHLAGTFANGTGRVYLGAREVGLATGMDTPDDGTGNISVIGETDGRFGLDGYVAEVRIWNRQLSPAELAANEWRMLKGDEPGLVAYWCLNEASGAVAYDATGRGHDLTVVGSSRTTFKRYGARLVMLDLSSAGHAATSSISWVATEGNYGWAFDGISNYAVTGVTPGNVGTIEVEFTPPQDYIGQPAPYVPIIVCGRNVVAINWAKGSAVPQQNDNGAIDFVITPSPGSYSRVDTQRTEWLAGQTYHVAVRWNGSVQEIFVDGQLQGSVPQKYAGGWGPLTVAKTSDNVFARVIVKSVRVWSSFLDDNRIRDSIASKITGTEPDLVAWWDFTEADGQTVPDKGPNGHHATLYGGNLARTSVDIETNLSLDGGTTWLGWKVCTNGGPIPDVGPGTDLANARLKIWEHLHTTDPIVEPVLHLLQVAINNSRSRRLVPQSSAGRIHPVAHEGRVHPWG